MKSWSRKAELVDPTITCESLDLQEKATCLACSKDYNNAYPINVA